MCRGSSKHGAALRVLVVGENDFALVGLKNCYVSKFRPFYAKSYDSEVILGVSSVDQAESLVKTGFNPHVVIVSKGFPETEREKVNRLLRASGSQFSPFLVGLPE